LVFYSLSGVTLAHAVSEEAASGTVLKSLNAMIRNVNTEGISSTEANVVRLHECEAKIISTEAIIYHCQPLDDEGHSTEIMGLPEEEKTLAMSRLRSLWQNLSKKAETLSQLIKPRKTQS
jgi:hypothetical protein